MNDLIKMVFLLCMAGILSSTGLSGYNNDWKDSTETTEERNENEFDDKSNVKDSEELNELKDLAGKKGITIPREESAKSKYKIKVLSDIKASEFDKKWCKELMDKHEKSINKLESAAIADPDLKEWVAELLPKPRIHHDRLMQFHNKLK